MEKADLINLLNEILKPLGFKKKGNNWILVGDELEKVVNLQKSQFGRVYYINCGYVIKALALGDFVDHVGKRVSFPSKVAYPATELKMRLTDSWDLDDGNIPHEERIANLRTIFQDQLLSDFGSIDTVKDLSNELREHPNLTITRAVKQYLNLSD